MSASRGPRRGLSAAAVAAVLLAGSTGCGDKGAENPAASAPASAQVSASASASESAAAAASTAPASAPVPASPAGCLRVSGRAHDPGGDAAPGADPADRRGRDPGRPSRPRTRGRGTGVHGDPAERELRRVPASAGRLPNGVPGRRTRRPAGQLAGFPAGTFRPGLGRVAPGRVPHRQRRQTAVRVHRRRPARPRGRARRALPAARDRRMGRRAAARWWCPSSTRTPTGRPPPMSSSGTPPARTKLPSTLPRLRARRSARRP